MAVFNYKVGMHNVGSYMVSGIPYISSSIAVPPSGTAGPILISFPRVTKFVTVRNTVSTDITAPMRVGFAKIGTVASGALPGGAGFTLNGGQFGANFFILNSGESYTGDWRVKDIFLMGDTSAHSSASVIAGLTSISTASVDFSNWSGSLGVG